MLYIYMIYLFFRSSYNTSLSFQPHLSFIRTIWQIGMHVLFHPPSTFSPTYCNFNFDYLLFFSMQSDFYEPSNACVPHLKTGPGAQPSSVWRNVCSVADSPIPQDHSSADSAMIFPTGQLYLQPSDSCVANDHSCLGSSNNQVSTGNQFFGLDQLGLAYRY